MNRAQKIEAALVRRMKAITRDEINSAIAGAEVALALPADSDPILTAHRKLFDVVADMIDREKITEDGFPDDFEALHKAVTQILLLDPACTEEAATKALADELRPIVESADIPMPFKVGCDRAKG